MDRRTDRRKKWCGGLAGQELHWVTPLRGNVQRLLILHGRVWSGRAGAALGTCLFAVMSVIYRTEVGDGTGIWEGGVGSEK